MLNAVYGTFYLCESQKISVLFFLPALPGSVLLIGNYEKGVEYGNREKVLSLFPKTKGRNSL